MKRQRKREQKCSEYQVKSPKSKGESLLQGCLLCNASVAFLGFFFPVSQLAKVLGEAVLAYGLCEKCVKLEECFQLAEEKIISKFLER